MRFSTTLTTALLTGTTLAAPLTAERAARHEARRQARTSQSRHGNPPFLPDSQSVINLNSNETAHEQYSQNWAGAVLIGTGYTSVTGTFTVPTPKAPSDSSSGDYAASAWVGIDGDTWSKAILQTGVDFTVSNGEPSFSAWYEWYPDYAYDFSGIDISAGDQITVTVEASSTSAGTATVENVSNGQKVSHSFSGETSGELGELNAEWIVEDFEQGGSLVPLANFGTVTFSGAKASSGGESVGPSGATIMDIKQSRAVIYFGYKELAFYIFMLLPMENIGHCHHLLVAQYIVKNPLDMLGSSLCIVCVPRRPEALALKIYQNVIGEPLVSQSCTMFP